MLQLCSQAVNHGLTSTHGSRCPSDQIYGPFGRLGIEEDFARTNDTSTKLFIHMIPGDREGEAELLHISVLQADQVYQGGGRKAQTGIYPRPQTVVAILGSSPLLQDLAEGKLPV